ARHSLDYPALPDRWLLFDVYDRRKQKHWSHPPRNALPHQLRLAADPRLPQRRHTLPMPRDGPQPCHGRYRDGMLEGVIVRREDENWLLARGKLVRANFTQAIDSHWRSRRLEWNRVHWAGNQAPD